MIFQSFKILVHLILSLIKPDKKVIVTWEKMDFYDWKLVNSKDCLMARYLSQNKLGLRLTFYPGPTKRYSDYYF